MDRTQSKIDRSKIAWQHFTNVGELMPGVRPIIARSWLRCKKHGINPKGYPENCLHNTEKELFKDYEPRLTVLTTILQECCSWFNSGLVLMLIHNSQRIVATLGQLDVPFISLLRPGQLISEKMFGTFAPALALQDKGDHEVIGCEHFMACFHQFHSLAVHFFAYDEAWLLGALLPVEQSGPQSLGLLKAITELIDLKLQIFQTQVTDLEVVPLAELEKREIIKALEASKGNITQAAELLEIPCSALAGKIRKYDLVPAKKA